MPTKVPLENFIRVAAAVPPVKVADSSFNTLQVIKFAGMAHFEGAQVVVFPELAITGYCAGDLFQNRLLLKSALEQLAKIQTSTSALSTVFLVGLPIVCQDKLLNVAAVIYKGKLYGLVPKTYQPNYKEFYEERWFASARDLTVKETKINGQMVPIGTDLIFTLGNTGATLAVEICEDFWVPVPPSSFAVLAGANIVANLSTSNELVGKADYRRDLVRQQSARALCGYVYSSSGPGESSTDLAFGGHAIIGENGAILAESKRFDQNGGLILQDIDLEHLSLDRERTNTFGDSIHEISRDFRPIVIPLASETISQPMRSFDPHPFVPADDTKRDERSEEVFSIQTTALIKRLSYTGSKKVVLGLSGGLDSTLVLLAAVKAFNLLNLPLKNICTVTMPGFGTTSRTKSNAWKFAEVLGVSIQEIDIRDAVSQHFKDIGHDSKNQNVVFENSQARERTQILMDLANKLSGLVLGTGDLSESALGWCTFNGDHISMYNINAGVPKTLVKHLVRWISEQPDFAKASAVLQDILDTPISPELTGTDKAEQKTEDIVGPYELHDFFLYHFVRWGSSPRRIFALAQRAKFDGKFDDKTILKWLRVFLTRFFQNQFKRSVASDGPKVGSVSLSPRGDWRMPSDAELTLWLKDLEAIEI